MISTLPRIEWVWGPDGRRKEIWVFPSEEGNFAPAESSETAEGSDPPASGTHEDAKDNQRALQFTAVPMPRVKTSSKLDEFALDVLLAQCPETKPGGKR